MSQMPSPLKVAVLGARGYSGLELVQLLISHSNVRLVEVFGTKEFSLQDELLDSRFQNVAFKTTDEMLQSNAELFFLATPAEVSLEWAPKLIENHFKVIDLSGAFRLKKHNISEWYPFSNGNIDLLAKAVYGFQPFTDQKNIQSAQLIANPGCYATAISLALVPLALLFEKFKSVDINNIVVDAKSGTTGAGKNLSEDLLFSEIDGNFWPYKIGKHQHYPEIIETVENVTNQKLDFILSTQLFPISRGIQVGVYARSYPEFSDEQMLFQLSEILTQLYGNYPLILFANVSANKNLLKLKKVVGTPKSHISYHIENNKIYIYVSIDNLLKGAASQAIENMNAMMGWPIDLGLKLVKEGL